MGRSDFTYKFAHRIGRFLALGLLKTTVEGADNIPADGPAILACNHVSYLDPPLLASTVSRPVRFMGKQELFEIPGLGRFLRSIQCLPVRRGAPDIRAVRASLGVLRRGELLGIFPEGTRYKRPGLHAFHHGAGWLAIKERVPVIPAAILGYLPLLEGTDWTRPGKMRIVFGKPLFFLEPDFPSGRRPYRRLATELIHRRVSALVSCDGRGVVQVSEPV